MTIKNKTCEGIGFYDDGSPRNFGEPPCGRVAVTSRKSWRWGDSSNGEPAVVNTRHYYCQKCADFYDEIQAEGAAEAAAS